MPLRLPASIVTYSRRPSLGATARPMRPSPSANVGRPFMMDVHVVPPSVDLNSPLPGPCQTPVAHGAGRGSDGARELVLGWVGAKAASMGRVFSSRYQVRWNVRPPSVGRYSPRSRLGP